MILTITCVILTGEGASTSFNPWDKFLDKHVCQRFRRWVGDDRSNRVADCAYAGVLALSDTQLVFGFAALSAGLRLMNKGTLDAYHFLIITDLAWLSSNTHLLSLIAIRSYWNRHPRHKTTWWPESRDIARYVRICLMLAVLALLLYATWFTGWENFYSDINCPMRCIAPLVKPGTMSGTPRKWVIFTYIFTLTNYPLSVLFATQRPISWLREIFRPLYHKQLDKTRWSQPRLFLNRLFIGAITLWVSDFEDLVEQPIWFGIGMYSLIDDRNAIRGSASIVDGISYPIMPSAEFEKMGVLGFGQLVPLFMLLLLPLALLDAWKGPSHCLLDVLLLIRVAGEPRGMKRIKTI